ncbi:MAG: MFS transporter [Anaerolineae bacterium]|nr:MFS transporter [Anaerolineae bacterium]
MAESKVLREEFVPLSSRIWVSAADAACAMLQGLAGSGVLTYYFTRWRGLDPLLAARVWILFGIWNAINDPLFGYVSDRTRSGLGRRIPYIRYGAPLYALAFIACWINWPGSGSNQTAMFLQMLVLLFFFDILYTSIATSIYVMPFEMAISNKVRSSILLWKIIFAVFPLAVPLVLIPMIQPGPGEDATLYQLIMVAFGIGMGATILVSTFFYREKHFQRQEEQFPFFKSLWECFTNRSFILFEVMSFTIIYVQTGLMQGVLYYFDEIAVPPVPLYVALAVGIVAGVVLFMRQREAWGVKKSMRIMALLFSCGCFAVLLGGRLLVPAAIGFFCFGLGFSGGMYLIPLMNGDVVDMDEHRTGLRREGMYAGVNSFITKPAISIAQAVFLWFLARYGYDQSLAKGLQSTSAETGILVGWTLVPGLLLFFCFVVLHGYPLAGEEWNKIKARLAVIHEKKERQYLAEQGYRYVE